MKYSRLACVLSLVAIGSWACSSPPEHNTGGKGGEGDTGGDTGGTTGGSGGTPPKPDAGATGGKGGSAGTSGSGGMGGMAGTGGGGMGGMAGMGGMTNECAGAAASSLLCKPTGDFPPTMKETGFFPSAPDLTVHSKRLIEYVPDPPLWSDGMEKLRFIVLPPGAKIDNSERGVWKFPDGTIFIKNFFDDSGTGGKPRIIETRFIRAGGPLGYEFYLYKWKDDGSDADLLVKDDGLNGDINGDQNVPITIKRMENGQPFMVNNGAPFMHNLPSRNACGQCHEDNAINGRAQKIIGFDELRLNSKFPATAAKTQLDTFAAAGMFTTALPTPVITVTDPNPQLQRIKRFVEGNCTHCHGNGSVFDLHAPNFIKNTVNQPTNSQSVTMPIGWARILPGKPTMSVLYVQVQRTMIPTMVAGKPVRMRPMPPVGVANEAANQEFLKDLSEWITAGAKGM